MYVSSEFDPVSDLVPPNLLKPFNVTVDLYTFKFVLD